MKKGIAMYFVRTYNAGGAEHDPRRKLWAEFHCSLCEENTDFDITTTKHTFQFDRERKCPHCGQINSEDKFKNLQAQLDKLTEQKSKIEIEIDRIERELNENKIVSKER
ncbi:MAG: hypothetical protein ACOC2U_02805 [bacterium]